MNPTEAFEAECRRKVGHVHSLAVPDREPTYEDFVSLFPPTTEGRVQAAQAAGYGTAASTRGNAAARTRRRTFMRNMQRYEAAEGRQRRGRPQELGARESGIVRAQWRRESRPHSVRGVLRLLNRFGATVFFSGDVQDSQQVRYRDLRKTSVGIRPEVLQAAGFQTDYIDEDPIPWDLLAGAFWIAYGQAYGMGDLLIVVDVEELRFRVGYSESAKYDFGSHSRPLGAKRSTEKTVYKSKRWAS